jgi:alkylated DNA nucleotide flippase Atl1
VKYITPKLLNGKAWKMLQIRVGLKFLVDDVELFKREGNLGLTFHDIKDGKAVWSVGNCLIVARALGEALTELELFNFRREPMEANKDALQTWGYLVDRIMKNLPCDYILDSERVVNKTMAIFPRYTDTIEEQAAWEAEQILLKTKSVEQATEELLGAEQIKTIQRKRSGRPHLQEDIWAWKQVNEQGRIKADVYPEWETKTEGRNLCDPKRQFTRITAQSWLKMTK